MRREVKILAATVVLGAGLAWGDRVPEALGAMEAFRVADVEIVGLYYLSRQDALDAMGITAETSVWGDTDAWAESLEQHGLVRHVRVERRIPDGLLVVVEEREPVAFVSTPLVEPVDAEGVRLPIDPAEYRLDLPLVETTRPPADGSRLLSQDLRTMVGEVGRLMTVDTAFLHMISEVRPGERGTLIARWADPDVDFLLPYGLPQARLREGLIALADAVSRDPGVLPAEIDLRFADQVVVRNTAGN
jgi:POTRA domain-containing FtsQ-type protein